MKLAETLMRGVRADQPDADAVGPGTLYCVTDEGHIIEQSDGAAAWDPYSPGPGDFGDLGDIPDTLAAIAAIAPTAGQGVRYTDGSTAETIDITDAAVDLLDDADSAEMRDTLDVDSSSEVDSKIASAISGGASDVVVYKGATDCSANPNYPAADAGHLYIVSVAGKIGGASGISVEAGDLFLCRVDSTASGNQATVGANWDVLQTNLVGAVAGPSSATDLRIAIFDGTTGKLIKDGGKLLTDFILNTLVTTLGDIIYASSASTPARLAGNTSATKKFLRSTGSGGVATAPAWDTIVENDIGASTNDAGNSSTAITVDWSLGRVQKVTLTGNATITHSNMVAGLVYTLELHTGAGAFTGTFASTNWAAGTAPTVTVTASKLDMFTFTKTIGGTILGAVYGQSFTP